MNNRRKLFSYALALLGLALTVFLIWPKPESLESVARRLHECLWHNDGGCLYYYTTQEERDAYNLTPIKMQALLNKYWNPRMQPLRKGPVEFSLMGSNGVASSSQRVFYSGGKASGVGFVVSKTDVGVRCLTLVGSLLLEVAAAKPMVVTDKLTPVDKLNAWALAAKEDRNVLEEIGINGLYRAEDEGLISWPQWEANCIERSARIKQRLAQKKQAHQ